MITYNEPERRNCFEAEALIIANQLGLQWGFSRIDSGLYVGSHVEMAWKLFNIGIEVGDRTRFIKVLPQPPAPPPGREVTDGRVTAVAADVEQRDCTMTVKPVEITDLTRKTMVAKLVEVKDECGAVEAKRIVKVVGNSDKMADIPADRIVAVIRACDELLDTAPKKKEKTGASPVVLTEVPCSASSGCKNSEFMRLQNASLDKVVDVALVMARNLSDEKNFSEVHDRLHVPFFRVCRYCSVEKDTLSPIQWTHREGCIVNIALQTIENYTDDNDPNGI